MPRKVISRPSICPLIQKGTPIHLSQKMFMERNYQQEKTNSLVRYCPLCDIYFCGSVNNGDGVRLECGVPERTGRKPDFTKTPEQGDSATWVPAYTTGLENRFTMKVLRLKGRGGAPFLVDALKACSSSRARRHKTKHNN